MRQQTRAIVATILLLALSAFACTVPSLGPSEPGATPTPLGDTITFFLPAYTYNLEPGETVPGTRLHYVGRSGDAYEVRIDGLLARKQTGDSFIWNGVLAPGVYANYNLRLTTAVFGALPVAGSVKIVVFNPEPVELNATPNLDNAFHYSNIVVNHVIPAGRSIPGTTLVYEGVVTQGEGDATSRLAQLSGLNGYPYLALGDSLTWTGRLRGNVIVRYNLRVAAIDEDNLRLAGTADLWIVAAR